MDNHFRTAAEGVIEELREQYKKIRCEDYYVGLLSELEGRSNFEYRDFPKSKTRRLIVILESPHIDEFKEKKPKPALGATGANIRKHLQKLAKNSQDERLKGELEVFLMNAIQYQCSLGLSPLAPALRNCIFRRIWTEEGKDDFEKRLLGVYQRGDVVLNLCTHGGAKPYLRTMVSDAIRRCGNSIDLSACFEGNHPSSWSRSQGNLKRGFSPLLEANS